jgi:hypothetical protein
MLLDPLLRNEITEEYRNSRTQSKSKNQIVEKARFVMQGLTPCILIKYKTNTV